MAQRECESIRPLISAFLDGELSASESATLHQHLAACEHCREVIAEYQEMRAAIRRLPPVVPPPELSRAVWRETVEKPRPTGLRRLLAGGTLRVGFSSVAALAVLIIVSAFLFARGYERSIDPTVAASAPEAGATWQIYQPVRIEFNKAMDQESVASNLRISPPGEAGRLPMSWEGNTLIIGSDDQQSSLLAPNTHYTIIILPDARDNWGNRLGSTWSLSFRTVPDATAQSRETPESSPPADITGTPRIAQATLTPSPTVEPTATATTPITPSPMPTQPSERAQGVTPSPVAPTPTATRSPASPTPTDQITPSAAQNEPTPTSEPQPSPTPTEVRPTATPESSPTPTATATETPASSPSVEPATATPTTIPVTAAFGSVYWANPPVQARLGAPLSREVVLNAAELGFQHGTMYERLDHNEIYVLYADGSWLSRPDTWTSVDGIGGGPGPEANVWLPPRGFGKLWTEQDAIADKIGFAVSPEVHFFEGRVQAFEAGLMLYSDQGFVYVLYDDGTWELYPDTSGQSNTLPTTPTTDPGRPTETPTSTTPTPTTEESATTVPSDPTANVVLTPSAVPTETSEED